MIINKTISELIHKPLTSDEIESLRKEYCRLDKKNDKYIKIINFSLIFLYISISTSLYFFNFFDTNLFQRLVALMIFFGVLYIVSVFQFSIIFSKNNPLSLTIQDEQISIEDGLKPVKINHESLNTQLDSFIFYQNIVKQGRPLMLFELEFIMKYQNKALNENFYTIVGEI